MNDILTRYALGEGSKRIASEMGLSESAIRMRAARAGVRAYSLRDQQIAVEYSLGGKIYLIASQFRTSPRHVVKVAKRLGIPMRNPNMARNQGSIP